MTHPTPSNLPTTDPPQGVLALVSWASDHFAARGIDSPRIDAEILLSHALTLRRIDLYLQPERTLSVMELDRFRRMVSRRADREPLAYITGEKEFWSLGLQVTPQVLIPRPETECLVEGALAALKRFNTPGPKHILDLGTGSGAIILAMASECPQAVCVATDRSPDALAVARGNARCLSLGARVTFLEGDWFSPVSGRTFDVICSNPPYIRRGDIPSLQPEVSRYEPVSALDGGIDGTDCLVYLMENAPFYLNPGGELLLEMGFDQGEALAAVAAGIGAYDEVAVIRDYSGLDRVLRMRKG